MKKHLSFIVAICMAFSSFAAPWNIVPQRHHVKAPAFDDPYVTYYYGEVVNAPYALKLTVQFDHSVPEPYVATIQVFGVWGPGGASYREFNIYLNTGQWTKTLTTPMTPSQEAYVGVMDLLYYGPY